MSEQTNPLLDALKLPGRIFQLPSRGIFYHNGELADSVKDGEIHVHPMSALDEINMKNPDQLFSGAAVNTVFRQCVDGVVKPSDLLSKDVDAIMLFLRTVTYGASYEFVARHACATPVVDEEGKPVLGPDGQQLIKRGKDHTYICDIDALIDRMKLIDPTVIDSLYKVPLSNGQVVKLRPNRYQHVLDIIKANENKKEITAEDQQRNLTMMLLGIIDSVDSTSDPKLIAQWIAKVPSPLINRVADKIDGVNAWGSDLKTTCKCMDCGQDFEVEIPINPVSFFTE